MNFAEQLEQIVKSRIEKDSLTLPAAARPVAFKAIELTRAADFNMQDATSLIERTPCWLCKCSGCARAPPGPLMSRASRSARLSLA